ncbi:MAG: hypothetical protein IJZ13_02025, partial [Clostridia bacterium]|nr:hypothetical protein [Clostridia bacterium]
DGALKGSAPINAGDWSNMFRTDATKLPLVWETAGNNVYKIEFDWALPEGTNEDDTAEMRVLITSADGKTRGDQVTLYKKTQAAGTSGHFEQTVQFNGVARVKNQAFAADGSHNMELIFIAKYSPAVIIDNLKITDLSPAGEPEQPEDPVLPEQPDEPVGTETVILDTDFSTDSVDGLLALGGGVAKYYGNFDGDINGIVDGEWKSFKANYADDTASKKQWYSAWGTHTTDNPIIWGKNFAYRVEFDWSIPGACENAQFRLIMESAHTKTPALNDNGDIRPYQVGIYNTDGTYSDPGYVITQTDASSGSFKATFAVNNLNLPDNNTPVDGTVMRILIRSQLETFTIDNLKITRVAIEPDVKEEEPEEPPIDESNTKVLLETDFTSVPMGLGNTWGGAYEFVGVNDELDIWEADAENTPGGWKMICNTVYNVVPIVWGEGHSYKIEVSYSLPKGSGDAGRFELVLDKDDGTQDHRGMQTTVFNATKGAIEAGDTVYTYETVFVTAGQAAKGELNTDDHMMLKFMAKTLPAIYLHSVKITDLNAALTPEIDLPELDDSEEEQTQPINVWVKLTNADAAPIANQLFKLDVGEMLQFDANGCYKFENVLSGAYTINLLDADGNVLASAYYTILAGETTDIFSNFATIDKSVTDLYIVLEYAKGKLTVKDMSVDADSFGPADDGDEDKDDDVVLDPDDSTDSPATGDSLPMVAVAAVLLAGIAVIVSKKNRVNG